MVPLSWLIGTVKLADFKNGRMADLVKGRLGTVELADFGRLRLGAVELVPFSWLILERVGLVRLAG